MKVHFGKRIRILRILYGYSQDELAEKSRISPSAYRKMENGKDNIPLGQLKKLSKAFDMKPKFFMEFLQEYKNTSAKKGNEENSIAAEMIDEFFELLQNKQKKNRLSL